MISYNGLPLLLNTPELDKIVSEGITLSDYVPLPPVTNNFVPPGFLQFPDYAPPKPVINQLTWPTQLNAWATGYFLVDDDRYAVLTGFYPDGTAANLTKLQLKFPDYYALSPVQYELLLDDGGEERRFPMFIHTVHPVAQNLWLLVMVDLRYNNLNRTVNHKLLELGGAVTNIGPSNPPVTAATPLDDLKADVYNRR